ncbi:MAG: ribonuclease HII [Defluviitaleaceae bacterium]|nr:ribonuclease HII [Defluviitaleaceae bacterium]
MYSYEHEAYMQGYELVAGMDEVGRGPLAGPVLACCLILRKGVLPLGIDDSKKLSPKKREQLAVVVRDNAISLGIGLCDNYEVDRLGILAATHTAMARAVSQMSIRPDIVLIDGYPVTGEAFNSLNLEQRAIVKGDQKSVTIAAASIVAKVTRDRLMCEFAKVYPAYGFEAHKGYGTPRHIEAVRAYGACDIHRLSFLKNI